MRKGLIIGGLLLLLIIGIIIRADIFSPSSSNPDSNFSSQKIIWLNITKQDNFEKYIDLTYVKVNATRFEIRYKLNASLLKEISDCELLGPTNRLTCLANTKEKYLSDITNTDFTTATSNLKTFPINISTKNIRIDKNTIDLSKEGVFYVDLLNYDEKDLSKSVGEQFKIGFNSIVLETIESTNDVGWFSSIALDSNGVVHVSEYDATNGDLRYCNNTGGAWSCAIVTAGGTVGNYSSIAIDSNNKVHIAAYNSTPQDLIYCNNTVGTWGCTTIESSGDIGRYPALAIDTNNNAHIAHYDLTNGYLRYCNNTVGGTWGCGNQDTSAYGAQYNTIKINSSNAVKIAYYEYSALDLRYCSTQSNFGAFTCAAVDTANDVGKYASMDIDSQGFIHISNYDETNDDLRYCNNTRGAWSCSSIDTTGSVGSYSSLVIDKADNISIIYYDGTNTKLKLCRKELGSWRCIDMAGVSANSLGFPNGRNIATKNGRLADSTSFSDYLHMTYYSQTDLKYLRKSLVSCNQTTETCEFGYDKLLDNIEICDEIECPGLGNASILMKWDVNELCLGITYVNITEAYVQLYLNATKGTSGNFQVYYVNNETWRESTYNPSLNMTFLNITSGTGSSNVNGTWSNYSIINAIKQACSNGNGNLTIKLDLPIRETKNKMEGYTTGGNFFTVGDYALAGPQYRFGYNKVFYPDQRPKLFIKYNTTASTSDTTPPQITLLFPTNNSVTNNYNINYIFNVSDTTGIKNVSLWANWSGTWSFINNVSNLSGQNNVNYTLNADPTKDYIYRGVISTVASSSAGVNSVTRDCNSGFWIGDLSNDFLFHVNSSGHNQTDGRDLLSMGINNIRAITTNCTHYFIINDATGGNSDNLTIWDNSWNLLGNVNISTFPTSSPYGITTNGSDFWIADYNSKFVFHMNKTYQNQTDGFSLPVGSEPYGITTNGSYFFILDNADKTIKIYNSTGKIQTEYISLSEATALRGITSDSEINKTHINNFIVVNYNGVTTTTLLNYSNSRPVNYLWNIKSCDTLNNCGFAASNFTQSISTNYGINPYFPTNYTHNNSVGWLNLKCYVNTSVNPTSAYFHVEKYYGGWYVHRTYNITQVTATANSNMSLAVNFTNGLYKVKCNISSTGNSAESPWTWLMFGNGTVYIKQDIHSEPSNLLSEPATYHDTLDMSDFANTGFYIGGAMSQSFRKSLNNSDNTHGITFVWALKMDEYTCQSNLGCSAVINAMLNQTPGSPNGFNWSQNISFYNDSIAWHLHHMDWYNYTQWDLADGIANNTKGSCPAGGCQPAKYWNQLLTYDNTVVTNVSSEQLVKKMLAYFIIDSKYYPIDEVSGWLWVNTNITTNFFSKYVPLTFNNKYGWANDNSTEPAGNMGNWSIAPQTMYYPSSQDYQIPGEDLKTIIVPCREGGLYGTETAYQDINYTFYMASQGADMILCHYTHLYSGFGQIELDANLLHQCLNNTKYSSAECQGNAGNASMDELYPQVKYDYTTNLNTYHQVFDMVDETPPSFNVTVNSNKMVNVNSSETLWNAPALAVKNSTGYYLVELTNVGLNNWTANISSYNSQNLRVAGIDESYNVGYSSLVKTEVNIESPTTSSPVSVTYPKNITINFTVIDSGDYLITNVNFQNASIGGQNAPNTTTPSFSASVSMWSVNVSIPNLNGNQNLTLWINTTSTGSLGDTELNAVEYNALYVTNITATLTTNTAAGKLGKFFKILTQSNSINNAIRILKNLIKIISQSLSVSEITKRFALLKENIFQSFYFFGLVGKMILGIRTPTSSFTINANEGETFFGKKGAISSLTIGSFADPYYIGIRNNQVKISFLDQLIRRVNLNKYISSPLTEYNLVIKRTLFNRLSSQQITFSNTINRLGNLFKNILHILGFTHQVTPSSNLYLLDIIQPNSTSPQLVTNGENINVYFNFTKFGNLITDNVNVNNITIGGNQCTLVGSSQSSTIFAPRDMGYCAGVSCTLSIPRHKIVMSTNDSSKFWFIFYEVTNNMYYSNNSGRTLYNLGTLQTNLDYHTSLDIDENNNLYSTLNISSGKAFLRKITSPATSSADFNGVVQFSSVEMDGNDVIPLVQSQNSSHIFVFTRTSYSASGNVQYFLSTDGGLTFGTSGWVNNTGYANVRMGSTLINNQPAVLIWKDLTTRIGFDYYIWNGTAFNYNPDYRVNWSVCATQQRAFDFAYANGYMHVAYTCNDTLVHQYKLYDSGATTTWNTKIVEDLDNGAVNTTNLFMPHFAVRGTELYMFYINGSSFPRNGYYRKWNGNSWDSAINITTQGGNYDFPNVPKIINPNADYIPLILENATGNRLLFTNISLGTTNTIYNNTLNLWQSSCTVPAGTGINDLWINVTYSTDGIIRTNTESNAITYSILNTRNVIMSFLFTDSFQKKFFGSKIISSPITSSLYLSKFGIFGKISILNIQINSFLNRLSLLDRDLNQQLSITLNAIKKLLGMRVQSQQITFSSLTEETDLFSRITSNQILMTGTIGKKFFGIKTLNQDIDFFGRIGRILFAQRLQSQQINIFSNVNTTTSIYTGVLYNRNITQSFGLFGGSSWLKLNVRMLNQNIISNQIVLKTGVFIKGIFDSITYSIEILTSKTAYTYTAPGTSVGTIEGMKTCYYLNEDYTCSSYYAISYCPKGYMESLEECEFYRKNGGKIVININKYLEYIAEKISPSHIVVTKNIILICFLTLTFAPAIILIKRKKKKMLKQRW
jgi:hypothetical protein